MVSIKRAQGLALNTIIIAILVVVVLVVLILIFTGMIGGSAKTIFKAQVPPACASLGGICKAPSACTAPFHQYDGPAVKLDEQSKPVDPNAACNEQRPGFICCVAG